MPCRKTSRAPLLAACGGRGSRLLAALALALHVGPGCARFGGWRPWRLLRLQPALLLLDRALQLLTRLFLLCVLRLGLCLGLFRPLLLLKLGWLPGRVLAVLHILLVGLFRLLALLVALELLLLGFALAALRVLLAGQFGLLPGLICLLALLLLLRFPLARQLQRPGSLLARDGRPALCRLAVWRRRCQRRQGRRLGRRGARACISHE